MFIAHGHDQYRVDRDGWPRRTVDGSRAAHREHAMTISEDAPVIRTAA